MNYNYLLLIILLSFSCKQRKDTLFTQLDKDDTGVNFRNLLEESPDLNVLSYLYFYNGAGVAAGDVNKDGLTDLFFAGNMVKNRLFLNKGDFEFEDATVMSHVAEKEGWCLGATMADVNADGWLDIYVCRTADGRPEKRENLLFVNNGAPGGAWGGFTERAAEYGLNDNGYSTQAAFFDMDRDGDLDMFLLNHSLSEYTGVKLEMAQLREKKNPAFSSKLYRNDGPPLGGKGGFVNVSDSAGIIGNVLSFGLGLGISDVNADGWPDIYVCNDFNEQDYLYINNKNGTFTDRLPEYLDHVSLFSMGCDWADLNNDGLSDLITVDMLPADNYNQKMHMGAENYNKFQHLFSSGFYNQFSRNMLHLNNGDGSFSEIGQLAGISNTDWSWAALGADFDNDGWKDVLVTNGYVKDYTDMDFLKYTMDQTQAGRASNKAPETIEWLKKMPGSKLRKYLFHNRQNMRFEDVCEAWGLGDEGWSYGAAYADLDNDGDLDLITNKINDYAGIYRNNAEKKTSNNWLKIALKGAQPNEAAIGAAVRVYAAGQAFYQEMSPSRGYASSVDHTLNFGLGAATGVDSIVVVWPDGARQSYGPSPVRQTLSLQKSASAASAASTTPRSAYFALQNGPTAFKHAENADYRDFTSQTLLPHFFSRQGPCMASADVNADGLADLFIGGSKAAPGALLLARADGSFAPRALPSMTGMEQTGAAFFDADGDGDADLYIVGGGYEFAANDPALQDRLLLNDGNGNFKEAPGAVPQETDSGACVRPADADADGDIDLFVGGRVTPGRYPEAPRSVLLINDGKGVFSDQTAALAPALARAGMVSDASWMDLNGDKRPELVVSGEWMAPVAFVYQNGQWAPDKNVFPPLGGWWNCLNAADFDNDGDIDIAMGNLGLNAQLRAAADRPASLTFSDFDANGSVDPLISWFIGDKSYPAAFRDDLNEQLPMLKKKFNDYKSYANAQIKDFFTPEQLGKAQTLEARTFETMYMENKGGRFEARALPQQAQYAPVYAMQTLDVNGDGHLDLVLSGNNRFVRVRYGRYDANHGVLLLGDGKGGFNYVPQYVSGLNIRGDARSMLALRHKDRTRLFVGINDAPVLIYEKNTRPEQVRVNQTF